MDTQTNRIFATRNQDFQDRCKLVGIDPTKRQASRYRMNRGLAFNASYLVQLDQKVSKAQGEFTACRKDEEGPRAELKKLLKQRHTTARFDIKSAIRVLRTLKQKTKAASQALKDAEENFNIEKKAMRSKAGLK